MGGELTCIDIQNGYNALYNTIINGRNVLLANTTAGLYCNVMAGNRNIISASPLSAAFTSAFGQCANLYSGGSYTVFHTTTFGCRNGAGGGVGNTYVGGAGCEISTNRQWTYFTDIVKNSSTFSIKHPDPAKKETHKLVHTTVESPTAGDNMYRYEVKTNDCKAALDLPDYFSFLNKNEQVWITPKNHHGKAFGIVSIDKKTIEITSDSDGDYQVLVFATRKDAKAAISWRGEEMISQSAIFNAI